MDLARAGGASIAAVAGVRRPGALWALTVLRTGGTVYLAAFVTKGGLVNESSSPAADNSAGSTDRRRVLRRFVPRDPDDLWIEQDQWLNWLTVYFTAGQEAQRTGKEARSEAIAFIRSDPHTPSSQANAHASGAAPRHVDHHEQSVRRGVVHPPRNCPGRGVNRAGASSGHHPWRFGFHLARRSAGLPPALLGDRRRTAASRPRV